MSSESICFRLAQELCDFRLIHVEVCRGTERLRIPKSGTPLDGLDLRKTFSLNRSTGEIEQVGDVEEWQKLHKDNELEKGYPLD